MYIKKVTLLIALYLVGFTALGQVGMNASASFDTSFSRYNTYSQNQFSVFRDYKILKNEIAETYPGQEMRQTGRVLTILGGVCFVGGSAVLFSSKIENEDPKNYYSTTEKDNKGADVGSYLMVAGAGMLIPGIILWNRGNKKYNQYRRDQKAFLKVKGRGLSLSINL